MSQAFENDPQAAAGDPAKPPAVRFSAKASAATRKVKFRHLLFILLLFSGIIPLIISAVRLITDTQETLKTKEKELLTISAQATANGLSDIIAQNKNQLRLLGQGIIASPGPAKLGQRLNEPWVGEYVLAFTEGRPEILALHVVDETGKEGPKLVVPSLAELVSEPMATGFVQALQTKEPVYNFEILSREQAPGVVIAVPIPTPGGETLVVESLISPNAFDVEETFLIDKNGKLLWSDGSREEVESALLRSALVQDFLDFPMSVTQVYDMKIGGEKRTILARITPVAETGWGVVAHKDADVVFVEVDEMIYDTAFSSILLVLLALLFAFLAARWFSRPIQRLATASHEIAAGNFNRRVRTEGLVFEVADLADDFNRMSEYVENYIDQLKKAAEANRALFISTIRAFAATIDAKDPYTRGHSERVAAYSRSIARYLGLPKDMQEKVWIAAVLHDVGKIGVEDRILKKGGVLTPEEFEQMKQHPSIGADIVEPISQLREMIPGIRWHHEAWNGTGYPDKLKAEQIPLMARIIGVADTFDAITTTRPYQNAYSTDYALQTIKKLTGTKFDAKIVTAFLLAWEAGHIKMDKEQADEETSKVRNVGAEGLAAAPAVTVNPAVGR